MLSLIADRLSELGKQMTEQHQRLRSDVNGAVAKVEQDISKLSDRQTAMALDITTLKTIRELEEKQAVKRGTWAGIIAGFVFTILMRVADAIWGK